MEILWIVIVFLAGTMLGMGIMCIVQARREEELEAYEKQLKQYREKLEQELDFEFPVPSKDNGYFYQQITK